MSLAGRLRSPREPYLVLLVLALAFAYKLFLLAQRAVFLDPDEAYYLILARNLAAGRGYAFNGLPNIVFPPLLPLLIAGVNLILRQPQLSLGLITASSGVLLGFVTYLIARRSLPPAASLGCLVLALFAPALNAFLPTTTAYAKILYRGSDILNGLLVLAAVYWTIRLAEDGRCRHAALAGASLGLAYLTRPEGFILFVGLAALLAAMKLAARAALSWRSLACLLLVFAALAAPYVVYLKGVTGRWMLSGKVAAAGRYQADMLEVIRTGDWASFDRRMYALNPDGTEMNDLYFGYHRRAVDAPAAPPEPFLRRAWASLRLAGTVPRTLVPLPFAPFLLLGLGSLVALRSRSDFVLLGLMPYSLAIMALAYPIPRHHLFLVPLFTLAAVRGAAVLSSLVPPRKGIVLSLLLAAGVAWTAYGNYAAASRNFLKRPELRAVRETEHAVSRRLREAGARVVMSINPALAVWADSDWQVLPVAPLRARFGFGEGKRVDYAVIGDETRPFFHIVDMKQSRFLDRPVELSDIRALEVGPDYDFNRVVQEP